MNPNNFAFIYEDGVIGKKGRKSFSLRVVKSSRMDGSYFCKETR